MTTLLLFVCLISTDNCGPVKINGFINERQCGDLRPLLVDGWLVQHKQYELKRWICTERPDFLIYRFQS